MFANLLPPPAKFVNRKAELGNARVPFTLGVEMVRSLRGAIDDHGASVGVLATTSSFTAGQKRFSSATAFGWRCQDWFDLQDMLDSLS